MAEQRDYVLDGMTMAEAETTLQALAVAGYAGEIFQRYGGDGFGVTVRLQRAIGLGYTTLAPMTVEQWTQAIAQCFIDSAEIGRRDEERARLSGEPIWYQR